MSSLLYLSLAVSVWGSGIDFIVLLSLGLPTDDSSLDFGHGLVSACSIY